MQIFTKKLTASSIIPQIMNPGDAGSDLSSVEDYILQAGERKLFKTNLSVALPEGYYGRIAPRSGLAYKYGIDVLGGVVDANYRGDIGVILINLGQEDFEIKKGMRIAQIIIQPYLSVERKEVDSLDDTTTRGNSGFGSTGS